MTNKFPSFARPTNCTGNLYWNLAKSLLELKACRRLSAGTRLYEGSGEGNHLSESSGEDAHRPRPRSGHFDHGGPSPPPLLPASRRQR